MVHMYVVVVDFHFSYDTCTYGDTIPWTIMMSVYLAFIGMNYSQNCWQTYTMGCYVLYTRPGPRRLIGNTLERWSWERHKEQLECRTNDRKTP